MTGTWASGGEAPRLLPAPPTVAVRVSVTMRPHVKSQRLSSVLREPK